MSASTAYEELHGLSLSSRNVSSFVPAAGYAEPEDSPILHAAIAMAPEIRKASGAIEEGRHLPAEIVHAMHDAGIFGMAMPRAWGGAELDPLTQCRVIEALAMADASVGWCSMINCDGAYATAFLDQTVARAMYPDPLVPTAASPIPRGKAVKVEGGWRVSGQFPFTSGSTHGQWFWLGCTVPGSEKDGMPETLQCMLPASDCHVLDTWYTSGLRGTGSNDVEVKDVFVPDERTFSFQKPNLIKREGPLYALPAMFSAKISAPALGVARHALNALIDVAGRKPAQRFVRGDQYEPAHQLRDQAFVQDAVGRAETMLAAARAHCFTTIAHVWTSLVRGEKPSPQDMAIFLSLHAYTIEACVDVVQLVCKTVGSASVYQKEDFDRCRRDVLTMNQHARASQRLFEASGQLLLGVEGMHSLL